MAGDLTLVLGGISSGKSAHAEALAEARGSPRLYIASAEAGDAEMRAKIAAHRARRGADWETLEAPHNVARALAGIGEARVVLFDCASMWLSNVMHADTDVETATSRLIAALEAAPVPVIVVSNEVGLGGVSANALARRYAVELGQLNQRLAAAATRVVLVSAGLPLTLKGAP